jgi:DNA-binding NtrC family response regulator
MSLSLPMARPIPTLRKIKFAQSMNKPVLGFSSAAMALLQQYEWPGNVRELQNAIERAVLVCRGQEIRPEDLPLLVNEARGRAPAKTLADVERQHIAQVLRETNWNISRAARWLGIDRVTLYNKIKKYHLTPESP